MIKSERKFNPNEILMKRLLLCSVMVLFFSVFAYTPTHAQLSANFSAGFGISPQNGSGGIWGGGLGVKYFLTSSVAVGARVRTYIETVKEENNALNGRLTAATVPVMGTFEYQFLFTDLHPYVGVEAGIIRTALAAKLNYNGREVYNETTGNTSLGLAPKIGVGYDFTQGMSFMVEALYNIGFGKDQAGITQYNLRSTSRFLSIHAGVCLTFGNRF